MDDTDDPDLQLQRASVKAIANIKYRLTELFATNTGRQEGVTLFNRFESGQNLKYILAELNLFQEDPQLLDPHLNDIIPPLVARFLQCVQNKSYKVFESAEYESFNAIGNVLYTVCKVRGAKTLSRFLDNEPKYIEAMLDIFGVRCVAQSDARDSSLDPLSETAALCVNSDQPMTTPDQISLRWELCYVLLLWLTHLMLAPFDLSSISTDMTSRENVFKIKLPPKLPRVAEEVLRISMQNISSTTKTQSAAAALIVRLALRPDMRRIGLLDALLKWVLSSLSATGNISGSIHVYNGLLMFTNGLVASANMGEIGQYLPALYETVGSIFNANSDSEIFHELRSSTVAKKLAIKIQRNIVVQLLQTNSNHKSHHEIKTRMLNDMSILEDVIDFLLKAVGDRETPVRYAASKSLSVITTKLDPAMAEEVVEAVIGSLGEDVVDEGDSRRLTAVNPSRWHGLTLTLSHMLFRRTPAPIQVPIILNALFLALEFEQRSTTGNSVGSNVRDAANFGLWSLVRRYTTQELTANGSTESSTTIIQDGAPSTLQKTAGKLLVTACLDPAGNVRRGSSAALQELVGRHPNMIHEGIPLVQAVDFHAVGLRSRAMIEVAVDAAVLGPMYGDALMEGLFGWRGVNAPDATSRNFAATAVGKLSGLNQCTSAMVLAMSIIGKLKERQHQGTEERHGLVQSLSAILAECERQTHDEQLEKSCRSAEQLKLHDDLLRFGQLWALFDGPLHITQKDLSSASLRPDLTTEAIVSLVTAIGACTLRLRELQPNGSHLKESQPSAATIASFTLCMKTTDKFTLHLLPEACKILCLSVCDDTRATMIDGWIKEFYATRSSRAFGLMIGLGSVWGIFVLPFLNVERKYKEQSEKLDRMIMDLLIDTFDTHEVEARVIVIRSLTYIVDCIARSGMNFQYTIQKIQNVLARGLNDYTINEQGDIGSLVRLEALNALIKVWELEIDIDSTDTIVSHWTVHRLALEKLDRVRVQAAQCLKFRVSTFIASIDNLSDVSSYDYFYSVTTLILQPRAMTQFEPYSTQDLAHLTTLLEGFASSAGAGSESLIQSTRPALLDVLETLPLIERTSASLLSTGNALLELYKIHISNDRVLIPLLELSGFLLDANLLQCLSQTKFKWRSFLSLIQKSHFKSTNISKLIAALHVYRGLAEVQAVRVDVLLKLANMLLHPFPKIRVATAEILFVLTADEHLKAREWSLPANEGKGCVDAFKHRHISK